MAPGSSIPWAVSGVSRSTSALVSSALSRRTACFWMADPGQVLRPPRARSHPRSLLSSGSSQMVVLSSSRPHRQPRRQPWRSRSPLQLRRSLSPMLLLHGTLSLVLALPTILASARGPTSERACSRCATTAERAESFPSPKSPVLRRSPRQRRRSGRLLKKSKQKENMVPRLHAAQKGLLS